MDGTTLTKIIFESRNGLWALDKSATAAPEVEYVDHIALDCEHYAVDMRLTTI